MGKNNPPRKAQGLLGDIQGDGQAHQQEGGGDGGAAVLPTKHHQEAEADQQHGHHLDGTDVSQGVEDGLNLSSHGDSDHRGSGWDRAYPKLGPPPEEIQGASRGHCPKWVKSGSVFVAKAAFVLRVVV